MKTLLLTIALSLKPTPAKAIQDTIKLPDQVAKTVVKELTSCDSLKAIHTLTSRQLLLTEQKVVLKDSIINEHVKKGIMYESIVTNNGAQLDIMDRWAQDLRKDNKKLRVKLTFTQITLTGIIGFLGYLYITK
jgi:hypothetical protein